MDAKVSGEMFSQGEGTVGQKETNKKSIITLMVVAAVGAKVPWKVTYMEGYKVIYEFEEGTPENIKETIPGDFSAAYDAASY